MARRHRRKTEKAKRHAPPAHKPSSSPAIAGRRAAHVERLAYTRTQAAEALGVSRSTFDRRVLPLLETVDLPWGTRLVPVDELERLVSERRRPARGRARTAPPGRPRAVPDELVLHIQEEHTKGKSLRQIVRDLNAAQTPTAHGGAQWWPSTVRAVLAHSSRLETSQAGGRDSSRRAH
jgi:Recombinase